MKNYVPYIVAIILVIAGVRVLVKFDNKEEKDIITAFESENYIKSESEVDSFFYYGDIYLTQEDRKELLYQVASGMGINNECTYSSEKTEDAYVSLLEYKFNGGTFLCELNTVESEVNKNVSYLSHYITTKMTFVDSPETAWYYKEKMADVLSGLPYVTIIPDVTLSLNGKIPGKLTDDAKNEMSKNLLNQLSAKEVFGNTKNGDTKSNTVYGYTENMQEYTTVAGKKVNINIAFSYDEKNNLTNLYLSTPLIQFDY